MNYKILVVDDEEDVCEIIEHSLSGEGYEVEHAYSAEEALLMPLENFDLLLLDVMMEGMSGFELAEEVYEKLGRKVPIIFVTARDHEDDVLQGFNLGADDYIRKPFSIQEISVRVKAVLRRTADSTDTNTGSTIKVDDIELDIKEKRLLLDGEATNLTPKEFELLKLFMQNYGQTFSREEIKSFVWSNQKDINERTIDVNITRLRKKLGRYSEYFLGRSGYGYCFQRPNNDL